ncbi:hypothetical protein ARZXY2_4930 (plasmid) [Arthrobacter sp. ZXY-2]|nr:hypothetical protein ARZXY2_4930 [Arthrobacter sp. ZXY-2]
MDDIQGITVSLNLATAVLKLVSKVVEVLGYCRAWWIAKRRQ